MFEYLMPTLFMRDVQGSLLDQSNRAAWNGKSPTASNVTCRGECPRAHLRRWPQILIITTSRLEFQDCGLSRA